MHKLRKWCDSTKAISSEIEVTPCSLTPKAKHADVYINLADQIIKAKDLFDLPDGCQWPSCELESKEANSSTWEDY